MRRIPPAASATFCWTAGWRASSASQGVAHVDSDRVVLLYNAPNIILEVTFVLRPHCFPVSRSRVARIISISWNLLSPWSLRKATASTALLDGFSNPEWRETSASACAAVSYVCLLFAGDGLQAIQMSWRAAPHEARGSRPGDGLAAALFGAPFSIVLRHIRRYSACVCCRGHFKDSISLQTLTWMKQQ